MTTAKTASGDTTLPVVTDQFGRSFSAIVMNGVIPAIQDVIEEFTFHLNRKNTNMD